MGPCTSNEEYTNDMKYTQKCCLAVGNYNITCTDDFGDGWHDGYLEINGIKYCEDFSNGKKQQENLSVGPLPIGRKLNH